MMKHGVHSQNQSIISKNTKIYSKFHKMTKPIPALKDHRQGSVLSLCEILNNFWYFFKIIDCFWEYTTCFIINELFALNRHFVLLRSGLHSLDLPINNFRLVRKEALLSCYRNKQWWSLAWASQAVAQGPPLGFACYRAPPKKVT